MLADLMRTCDQYSPSGRVMLKRIGEDKDSIRAALPDGWWNAIRFYV